MPIRAACLTARASQPGRQTTHQRRNARRRGRRVSSRVKASTLRGMPQAKASIAHAHAHARRHTRRIQAHPRTRAGTPKADSANAPISRGRTAHSFRQVFRLRTVSPRSAFPSHRRQWHIGPRHGPSRRRVRVGIRPRLTQPRRPSPYRTSLFSPAAICRAPQARHASPPRSPRQITRFLPRGAGFQPAQKQTGARHNARPLKTSHTLLAARPYADVDEYSRAASMFFFI
jgi:hypothetical protein